ncbi:helix-turn-helix transcriptional regulator [Paenibacillus sp. IB182496]|uniref:Helix-turn-helix transcriptional regulator n=1 Tax=Paenibacillus sabuli TaxID=2772509 RepID=A0A927BWK1_9BACL|nr:AraC family transcriptional regulator [Paenibacillus sabuli]MBD2847642.1 helix-turn-helix transcriptional regulator [Paenibacillus sabuli]
MPFFSDPLRDHLDLPQGLPILVARTAGVSPPFQRLHRHTALEINAIAAGSGYYLINGVRYDFDEGDLVLINANDLHRAFETEGLVMDIVMVQPAYLSLEQRYDPELLLPLRELGSRLGHVIRPGHPAHARLMELVCDIKREYEARELHYEAVIRAQLVRLFAYAGRTFGSGEGREQPRTKGMETIRELLRLMEEQPSRPWTLAALAEAAHLSPSHLSALFVRFVGTSPMDYLIQLRLARAVELIETTDRKLIDIAGACGFRNLSNFNRLFKQHLGKPPSELRRAISAES